MKFVVAVVMLALAVGVHSSLLGAQISPGVSYVSPLLSPLLAPGLGLGPLGLPAAVNVWGGSAPGLLDGIPGISLSQGPGAAIAAPIAVSHALGTGPGVYVAKTRGAIHTAPLAGHINSATSLNLAPAPGTL
ncbi:adult cuticle protein 1-like [Anastrepha ludens]|uniref:adult cuticle protein 1-like n=1 Tax=Anastrepha ludens TaxID=28586 RepID=UPI0023B110DB|nr:adult cuticle protein 1-like [Anastrepha ludens]